MEDEFDGDFTTSTGDLFGKGGKSRKHEKHARKKGPSGRGSVDKSDEGVKCKRLKGDEVDATPQTTTSHTPSNRVASLAFRGINVADYIEARALEVANTMGALDEAAKAEGKRVLQRLPRHMRRRAASYDARRIPRNQRKTAIREVKDNPIKRGKMPSRKHRRRPKNLLEEYNRRKKNHAWLETHIWHAKRFKMVEKWGYKMAEEPCDKGLRSAYRASSTGCLLQDISFQGCIEINGPEVEILEVFQHITHKHVGTGIAAKNVLSGERSVTVLLYKSYPNKAVSPVDILWKPYREGDAQGNECLKEQEVAAEQRTLWVWCHPASHDDVLNTVKDAFIKSENGKNGQRENEMEINVDINALECMESYRSNVGAGGSILHGSGVSEKPSILGVQARITDDVKGEFPVSKKSMIPESDNCKEVVEVKGLGRKSNTVNFRDEKMEAKPHIHSESFDISKSIQIKSMKLDFVKFRLTGPLSHKVLVNTLQLHKIVDTTLECWWREFYSKERNIEVLKESIDAWHMLSAVTSPGQFPPNVVLGLTVVDPRMNIPIKKTWPGKDSDSEPYDPNTTELLANWPKSICQSPLWDAEIRNEVKKTKISEAQLNMKRSEMLNIGQRLEVADETSRIPILLVQRPGVQNPDSTANHYGCGWDFIAPSGWGMPFLVSFVYRGAHVGGLREERNIHLEGQVPYFPRDFPDTKSGQLYLDDEKAKSEEFYNRRPPGKRTNYEKYGVCHPFGADWRSLVIEWKNCCREVLKSLGSSIGVQDMTFGVHTGKTDECRVGENVDKSEMLIEDGFYVLRDKVLLRTMNELLFFQTFPLRKRPADASLTSLAGKRADVLRHLFQCHQDALVAVSFQCLSGGQPSDNALISIPSKDDFENRRADKKCAGPVEALHKGPKAAFPAIADAYGISRSLVKSIGLCTRWTIGQVTSGRYSLRTGKGTGIGLVTVPGLLACLEAQPSSSEGCVVLLRNVTSQQYRFGRINVIL